MSQFGRIEFVNKTSEPVTIIALDERGEKVELPALGPDASTLQLSPMNVAWVVLYGDFTSERLTVDPDSHVVYSIVPTVRLEKGVIKTGRGGDL